MVAKIVSGKSIRGILNYNENKVNNAEAQLLIACGFPRDPDQLSFKNKLERFEMLTSQNLQTKTNAMHISLNFSVRDQLDDALLKRIALEYMDGIGFGDQPFLVYRHYDAAHPHVHIATVNIADGGGRIETHNIGRNQSEKTRKELEERFNLIRAEDQKKEMAYLLRPAKLTTAIYGRSETKAAVSAIVRDVVSSYKFTSLPELNAILRQFNVMADRGTPDSKMYDRKGLVYYLLDDQGTRIGIPIKASSIYSNPVLKTLESKYAANASARKPYGVRLKHLLDKSLKECGSREDFEKRLHSQGIRILMRENVKGNVYGITFIDNATRVVFNGSDLGKAYSASSFVERIQRMEALSISLGLSSSIRSEDDREKAPGDNNVYPAGDHPVMERMLDILMSDRHSESVPDPYRKKKKKRQAEEL